MAYVIATLDWVWESVCEVSNVVHPRYFRLRTLSAVFSKTCFVFEFIVNIAIARSCTILFLLSLPKA